MKSINRVTESDNSRRGHGATISDGFRAGLPIVIGYFPIAFSFGVAATALRFTTLEAVLLSVIIYSGASQFMALTLFSGGASAALAIITLLAMNLRHLLYAPALLDRAGDRARTRYGWAWAFGLTDEVFATTIGYLSRRDFDWSERWMLGLGIVGYLSWTSGTLVGALAGGGALAAYPTLDAALRFMLPALFLSVLLGILNRRQIPVVGVAAGVCVIVTFLSTATWGIVSGMIAGALAGMVQGSPAPSQEAGG